MNTKKPVLSIALMVSNRKDTIEQCLDSLEALRQAIPSELIITDTGCDAELHEYLAERADVVTTFTWCNDFAKARNESLLVASGEWYLYLDDDEWFLDTDEIIQFFQSGEYRNYGYANYIQRNYVDRSGVQYSDSWVSRMIQREPDTHFESRIHEYLAPAKGNCKGLKSIVHHYGYVFDTPEEAWKHYERNSRLLEEMIEEEPQEVRWRIQLAQEYRAVKLWDKLYELGEQGLALLNNKLSCTLPERIALGSFYASKLMALEEKKQYQEANAICQQAKEDKRNTELFQAYLALEEADILYRIAEAAEHKEAEHKVTEHEATEYKTTEYNATSVELNPLNIYQQSESELQKYFRWVHFFQNNEPMYLLQEGTAFIGECFDEVMKKKACSIAICCGLKQGNAAALEENILGLEWENPFVYVYEGIMAVIAEAMIQAYSEGREDHEAELWNRTIAMICNHPVLWSAFCRENALTGNRRTESQKQKLGECLSEVENGEFIQRIQNTYLKYYKKNIIANYPELLPYEAQLLFESTDGSK